MISKNGYNTYNHILVFLLIRFNPAIAVTDILRDKYVSILTDDVLAPCIARSLCCWIRTINGSSYFTSKYLLPVVSNDA